MSSTMQPQGEKLRKAVQWVSDEKQKNGDVNIPVLVDQACLRFDLTPEDSEFLIRFVKAFREK